MNPNIIPHPHLNDTWIMVAQQTPSSIPNTVWFAELVCNAIFQHGVLSCIQPPQILPIASTSGTKCNNGVIDWYNFQLGPHDARVFYSPSAPYVIFGSNGVSTTCLGQWALDFRLLVDWGVEPIDAAHFRSATELHRPDTYGAVEKNWFLFYDLEGNQYAHYDLSAEKRVFAKVEWDGTVGPDLAPLAAASDAKCLAAYMPPIQSAVEAIHQATNSLAITMCKRADADCSPTTENTFLITIFQHKNFAGFHSVYEPYILMFRQQPPFDVHAISRKPIWIHGRGGEGMGKRPKMPPMPSLSPAMGPKGSKRDSSVNGEESWKQTEMMYVTSMNWKDQGRKYHGFLDDVLFLAFGIEDETTGAIDVLAGDLLADMALCFGL